MNAPTPLPTQAFNNYNSLYNTLVPEYVPIAWNNGISSTGNQGQGVAVGIIDTGAQADNPALINRITWFKDYVDPSNTTPQDPDGHGTQIAELIGGTANPDGSGGNPFFGGVAPQASLYIARVGDSSGNFNTALLPQAMADLTAQGVKLINNSYGSTNSITSVTGYSAQVLADNATFKSVLANGQLLVWAAGNNGNLQPTVEAGLPYYENSLQGNWLAVVNVTLNSSGQVTGLDDTVPSNACGVAARWCLAAPGLNYFSPVANTQFSTGGAEGTSDSAAIVTGVAALVWQRFPYFSATNVQETLLGTATYLGSPTYYGYGLVNAAAAVNGPGLLDWGPFEVAVPAGVTSAFTNNMSGSGALILGPLNFGTLILTGNSTYTGGTWVDSGTLKVTGSISADVTIAGNGPSVGILEGPGTVFGNVTNAGAVWSTGGTLTIAGNYTVVPTDSNSGVPLEQTIIDLGSPLRVTGTATLNNSILAINVPGGYTPNAVEPLLYAGSISGTFGSLDFPSLYYSAVVTYSATEVDADITQVSVSSVAKEAMPNIATTQQTAEHIQTALVQANGWTVANSASHQTFLDAAGDFLHVSSIPLAEASINSLSGQLLASSQGLTFEQAGIVNRTVADRLVDIDQGNAQQGAWFQGTGADGDIARSGYATGNYSGGGSVAGYDVKMAECFVVGVGLDWNHLSSTYDLQGGSNTSRSTGAMLYAKYAADNAYLSGRIGEDWIHSDTSRWGLLGVVPAAITSSRNDQMTSAYLEGGYNIKSDAWTTTPFVSAGDEHLDRGAINEQGAGGFGITAPSDDFNQSYGQIGARLAYSWKWGDGQLSLKGYALYQRIMGGRDLGFTAAYAGAPNATFELEGVNTPRNSEWIGAGLNAVMNQHWSWYLDLDGQFASSGTKARTISAGMRYRF
ncbi:S8 family serine peptidase [Dyella monticola]|uniref:S8 family serine peptidase n=1 Tax=Dyella monticola TaxID=1927958 RepID=UPI0013149643|nr:S8 family serine peptidase [Dyella monticola]